MLDKAEETAPSGKSRTGEDIRDHGEKEAARMVRAGAKQLGLPGGASALAALAKSDERKIQLALLLREKTSVTNDWIANRLVMGHPGSVSRMISAGRSDKKMADRSQTLVQTLSAQVKPCES